MVAVSRAPEFDLTDAERAQLVAWAGVESRLGTRSRIVLACAEPDVVYARVARDVGVTETTVGTVRGRFAAERLDGLRDRARSGRPKADLVLTDREREQLQQWSRRATSAQALAL